MALEYMVFIIWVKQNYFNISYYIIVIINNNLKAQQPNASLEAEFLESFGALKSHTDDKLEESKPTELFLFSMKSFLETKVGKKYFDYFQIFPYAGHNSSRWSSRSTCCVKVESHTNASTGDYTGHRHNHCGWPWL
jgi:hypothetical protein